MDWSPNDDETERALADLRERLDALESGRETRKLIDDLRIEMREWLAEELNRIATRLEAGEPGAAAPEPDPSTERLLEDSAFTPYADQVEAQLREVEERVERAGKVVREISAGTAKASPAARDTVPDDPGPESQGSSLVGGLNRISFEQLRDLGLSVTQAAGLLARRDTRGGFASLDDLDDLAGFSRELIERLKRRLSLG
jgi:DNA uptake protein ComE-like DNA-binding protein